MKKEKIVYGVMKGCTIPKKCAQRYGERIANLIKSNAGEITPQMLLEDAKKENSVFHDHFIWDDSKAAYEHRLYQARKLIGGIVQVVVVEAKETVQRSFFNVSTASQEESDGQRAYVTLQTAVTVVDYRKELINRIIVQMQKATELLQMFKQYDK